MTTTYWGNDCATSFQAIAANVHAAYGSLPSWVGRYIGTYALTPGEIAFLHSNNIRILPIWNSLTADQAAGDDAEGAWHGTRAVQSAKAFDIPAGTPIAVDIEQPWYPSAAFFTGYAREVDAGSYLPAAYLNVIETAHTVPFLEAVAAHGKPIFIYTSEPELNVYRGTIKTTWDDFSPWLGSHADLVLWQQYSENELNGTVDLDVATAQGYGLLWGPTPVVRTYTMKTQAGLKQQPNHLSDLALGPKRQRMILKKGEKVVPTGKTALGWTEVTVPGTKARGWVLSDDIVIRL